MTTTMPTMTTSQVRAEIQSIRKAADRVMTSKESAAKFLAAVRVPQATRQPVRQKNR
jgi:hypothetical protein